MRPGGRLRKAAAEISTTDDGRQTTFSHALKNEEKNDFFFAEILPYVDAYCELIF